MQRLLIGLLASLVATVALATDFWACSRANPTQADRDECQRQRNQSRMDELQKDLDRSARQLRDQVPRTPDAPAIVRFPPTAQEVQAQEAAAKKAAADDLTRAVLANDEARAKVMLSNRRFTSVRLDRGVTLLMVAAQRGMTVNFAELAKIDPGGFDQGGNVALHHLVADGPAPALGLLLDATGPTEIHGCNNDRWSALTLATALAKDALALQLLARGASPDATCPADGEPALVVAAALGRADVVAQLLAMGADPAVRSKAGLTALQAMASRPAQERLVQSAAATVARMRADMALATGDKAAGARPAASPVAPLPDRATMARITTLFAQPKLTLDLLEGARTGQVDAVRKALAAGADPRVGTRARGAPWELAVAGDHVDVLKLLLTPAVTGDKDLMFRMLGVAAYVGKARTMELVIRRGNLDDAEGKLSAVMNSELNSAGPDPKRAEVLLAAGVKPDRWRSDVLRVSNVVLLKTFLAAGMDVRSTTDQHMERYPPRWVSEQGYTALMEASAGADFPELVQALIDAGVDVNARSSLGRSALWYATKNARQRITQVLLKVRADPNVADIESGTTPLMHASETTIADPQTVQGLIDAGADVLARTRNNRPVRSPVAQVEAILQRAREVRLASVTAPATAPALIPPAAPVAAPAPSPTAAPLANIEVVTALTPPPVALTPPPVRGQWLSLGRVDAGAVMSVDKASISREGATARVWVLAELPQAEPLHDGKTYRSQKTQIELDCAAKRARVLQVHSYSGIGGDGASVASELDAKRWRRIVEPDMITVAMMKEAC